jgi:chromosome segregation protein
VLAALTTEQHRLEKGIVGHEAQLARAAEEATRLQRKGEVIALERRQAEEERTAVEARHAEAQTSIGRLLEDQRQAEAQLSAAQQRLIAAREQVEWLSGRAGDARVAHAALVERAAALAADVLRLEEGARELEQRIAARSLEHEQAGQRRTTLLTAIAEGEHTLDEDIATLDRLRQDVRSADDAAADVRARVERHDVIIHDARGSLDGIRAQAAELDLARATTEGDLSHLAQTCLDATQTTIDQVVLEVEAMEQAGDATPDVAAISAEEPDPDAEEGEAPPMAVAPPLPASMTAEEAIAALKGKIDRLGPVNMMAIEQFDELEARHAFLTTQRQDLIDSIAQTTVAIERIDETSIARFNEAFTAIQQNFQITFSTLFGGGRAGLALLDETDPLESGIDIVASPPGKRLQSVQLLSGGEKALTAIALMFAIFRYKPSPFCLLDEIDAPLDDANVGRFVEMLRGMLDRTQFILITHNRRTMEIANRLYGVTMEEPGVSKLISVQLN